MRSNFGRMSTPLAAVAAATLAAGCATTPETQTTTYWPHEASPTTECLFNKGRISGFPGFVESKIGSASVNSGERFTMCFHASDTTSFAKDTDAFDAFATYVRQACRAALEKVPDGSQTGLEEALSIGDDFEQAAKEARAAVLILDDFCGHNPESSPSK